MGKGWEKVEGTWTSGDPWGSVQASGAAMGQLGCSVPELSNGTVMVVSVAWSRVAHGKS